MVASHSDRPPVIFLHVGWAREYRGDADDPVQGKFGFIMEGNEHPGEWLNFKEYDGRCYGYAAHWTVSPEKLGAPPDADFVDGVLVIWTATSPEGTGRFIVGWFKNATVHTRIRKLRPDVHRPDVLTEADSDQCHLVAIDDRSFSVPTMKRGWPGRQPAWYPNARLSDAELDELLAYVDGTPSNGFTPVAPPPVPDGKGIGRPSTFEDRSRVEQAALKVVTAHYEALRWTVVNVDTEKHGWDLDVKRGERWLRVEVKGRSESGSVELTPREYRSMGMKDIQMSYRLAVVHHATGPSPKLTIFMFNPSSREWVSQDGIVLQLVEKPGAVASF